MTFQGDDWAIGLLKLDGSETWIRPPGDDLDADEYSSEVDYYFVDDEGIVSTTRDPKKLESMARENDGLVDVSEENPLKYPMLYVRLKPAKLREKENKEKLKPLTELVTALNKSVESMSKETGELVKSCNRLIDRLPDSQNLAHTRQAEELIETCKKLSDRVPDSEHHIKTRQLEDLIESCKKLIDRLPPESPPPASQNFTSLSSSLQELEGKYEALRQEVKELRKVMDG